jgi:hypothetical protein
MTEVHSCSYYCDRPECIKAQRDELRDRLAQPEQEPVAHVYLFEPNGRPRVAWDNANGIKIGDKLYTAPPQRKPLTDGELADLWYKQSTDWMEFARAIEAAHGIKGDA